LHDRLVVHHHPAVSVLQLDVDLAQPEEDELFLLGAFGDLGLDQGGLSLVFFGLGCALGCGQLGLDGGIAVEEPGCAVASLLEFVEEVGALVAELF
jgi:hypothetical protein